MAGLFYHVMQDRAGNLLLDVVGTMRVAGTGTLATIYGDEALTVVLPNPMTNHPTFASFKCFLAAGDYDFAMAKAGYSFETLTGIQGWGTMAQQNADTVAITGGSATFTGNLATTATLFANNGQFGAGVGIGVVAPSVPVALATLGDISVNGHLDVAGTVHAGEATLTAVGLGGYTATAAMPLNLLGTSTLNGAVGVSGAPNAAQGALSVYGTIWSNAVNGLLLTQGATIRELGLGGYSPTSATPLNVNGAATIQGAVGVSGGHNAAQGALSVYGTIWSNAANGLSIINGATIQRLGLGGYAADATYALNVNGLSALGGAVGIGGAPNGSQGIVSVYGSLWMTSNLLITTGNAYKPGGGGFLDISSRQLKTAIADVPDALGLLLAQRGRQFQWTEALRARGLPGTRYGFIAEEVTLPQWRFATPGAEVAIGTQGFEALCVEALRTIVTRLEALECA